MSRTPEHPRVCGENQSEMSEKKFHSGTSPRMRGKQALTCTSIQELRNIPAYAGKTPVGSQAAPTHAEHPRVCGENSSALFKASSFFGTSPRMRGKHNPTILVGFESRNIPAYAGKTEWSDLPDFQGREHPRVCGENVNEPATRQPVLGTSPRMRGKPLQLITPRLYQRNIPAYAGKTRRHGLYQWRLQEHPRVCGENRC